MHPYERRKFPYYGDDDQCSEHSLGPLYLIFIYTIAFRTKIGSVNSLNVIPSTEMKMVNWNKFWTKKVEVVIPIHPINTDILGNF